MRHVIRVAGSLSLVAALWTSAALADITVKGKVYYWNGDVKNDDGTSGRYVPAPRTEVQVENDHLTVGDITTVTDAKGQYKVTFKQRMYRPDFESLVVNVEVRARVVHGAIIRDGKLVQPTVSCYKGAVRLYPYNGQTRGVRMRDGETWTVNVYLRGPGNPAPPASSTDRLLNQDITSWDYDDDGRRTLTGLFMCQCCDEVYRFLVAGAARPEQLNRDTSLFYPEDETTYKDTASIPGYTGNPGTAWINVTRRNLFAGEGSGGDPWRNWRILRGTIGHEFSHKLMHDVYWTMPKKWPLEMGGHVFTDCQNGEMGWREGWAQFLPAAVIGTPTHEGTPPATTPYGNEPYHLEEVWDPRLPNVPSLPGKISWRDEVTGRRDWNEGEVAAVLWDIWDAKGWEYMPAAQQQHKREGWPAHLRWYDRLNDDRLGRIWPIVLRHPEALNDEDETLYHDSFWWYWLESHGKDTQRVHGLKAILHNRDIRHTRRPEHAPSFQKMRLLPAAGAIQYAVLTVKEPDAEDRPYLFCNVATGSGGHPLRVMYAEDQPLKGTWTNDQLSALVRLPARGQWDRVMFLVHDSMACNFGESGDPKWEDASATGPHVRLISGGGGHMMAFRSDGSVYVWGSGSLRGQNIGLLTVAERKICVDTSSAVPGLPTILAVAAGGQHCVALATDGSVWTWGYNYSGALGRGIPQAERHRVDPPARLEGLGQAVAVAAAGNHSFALLTDGTVMAWGDNGDGRLGDGTTTGRISPVRVEGLPRVKAIATGGWHSLAVDVDGRVWGWGHNSGGQLGDGTTECRLRPVQVVGIDGVVDVAVQGGHHSLALRSDGTVWEWGQRKDPKRWAELDHYRWRWIHQLKPVRVPRLSEVVAISSGSGHSIALRADGTVWTWGYNRSGQLGDGTTRSRWPVAIVRGLPNVVAIAAGGMHSAAVRSDGTVWCWGGGNLGNGLVSKSTTPVRVHTYYRIAEPEPRRSDAASNFQHRALRLFP